MTGEELRALRTGWMITLKELSAILGVRWETLQMAETGKIKVTRQRVASLRRVEPEVAERLQDRIDILNTKLNFCRNRQTRKRIYKELIAREEALEKLKQVIRRTNVG
jgi:predicted transcriptional regulator